MKHLRYLDLSSNYEIEVLPKSITKLQHLQTLLLNYCLRLRELPKDLWKLISLRHLELCGCTNLTCMPRGICQLTNLQTLTLFVFDTSSRHYSARACELTGLNNLRGDLEIKGLECLRRNPMEVKALNLMEKSYIESLTLTWNEQPNADDQDNQMAKDDILMENLQPHHNIKNLTINGFCGASIFVRVSSFTNIIQICIQSCKRLQNLPPLHLLPHLKTVRLTNLLCLEWIDKAGCNDSSSTFFPSLEELHLFSLPNLRGWWRCSEEGTKGGHCHQQPFVLKSLHKLCIRNCPNLISVPLHPYLVYVKLYGVSEKILQQTIKMCSTPLLSDSPLSTLQYLTIGEINDLTSLSGILQHHTALRELYISRCKELDPCSEKDGGMQWKELNNLHTLYLNGLPKMESLPEGIQYVTTLEMLHIQDCTNLKNIPEWVASLGSSLQVFEITCCPMLTSLPEGLHYLLSLKKLRIIQCPKLEERCRREMGEEWSDFFYVPKLVLDWD